MAIVKYTGPADERRILKSHFQGAGVENQDAVQFNSQNNFTAQVSQEAATWLVENDAFEAVPESQQAAQETPPEAKKSSPPKSG